MYSAVFLALIDPKEYLLYAMMYNQTIEHKIRYRLKLFLPKPCSILPETNKDFLFY